MFTLAQLQSHLRNYEQQFLGGEKHLPTRRILNSLALSHLQGGNIFKHMQKHHDKRQRNAAMAKRNKEYRKSQRGMTGKPFDVLHIDPNRKSIKLTDNPYKAEQLQNVEFKDPAFNVPPVPDYHGQHRHHVPQNSNVSI